MSSQTSFTFNECYRILRKLGSGSFGHVFQAEACPFHLGKSRPTHEGIDTDSNIDVDGMRQVAVKVFSLEDKKDDGTIDQRSIDRRRSTFDTERLLLGRLNHPHIVKLHESFEEEMRLYIVLELCRGGELYDHVMKAAKQTRRGLPETRAREYFRQMLGAAFYLHKQRIVHRDIKTENFLVVGEPGSTTENVVKMCDFGTAVQLHDQESRPMAKIGTPSYIAPEVYESLGVSLCSDMWSLGVVLYVMVVGAHPFRTSAQKNRMVVVKRIRSGDFDQQREGWLKLSGKARAFIKLFLVVEEKERITCAEAISNSWVSKRDALPPNYSNFVPTICNGIKRFGSLSQEQQFIIAAAARLIEEDTVMKSQKTFPWYEIFFILDLEHHGSLPINSFIQGMDQLSNSSMSKNLIEEFALVLDFDASGHIEWTKWIIVAIMAEANFMRKITPEPLDTIFRTSTTFVDKGMFTSDDLLRLLNTEHSSSTITLPRTGDAEWL